MSEQTHNSNIANNLTHVHSISQKLLYSVPSKSKIQCCKQRAKYFCLTGNLGLFLDNHTKATLVESGICKEGISS